MNDKKRQKSHKIDIRQYTAETCPGRPCGEGCDHRATVRSKDWHPDLAAMRRRQEHRRDVDRQLGISTPDGGPTAWEDCDTLLSLLDAAMREHRGPGVYGQAGYIQTWPEEKTT